MKTQEIRQYAELVVGAVNVQAGQNVVIWIDPEAWEFANSLAAAAYRRGARFVRVEANHLGLRRARVENSSEEFLDYQPPDLPVTLQSYIDEQWSLISIRGPEDPDALSDLDAGRNGRIVRAIAAAKRPFSKAVQSDKIRWIIAPYPSRKWAAKVFQTEPTTDAVDRLWSSLRKLVRLDDEDPIATWKAHAQELKEYGERLNELEIDELQFTAPGTDLTVGLLKESRWVGGPSWSPDGTWFLPNLPTEEVFTTPDRRRAEGTVQVTRPLIVMGQQVSGAWFRFSDGVVTDFGAEVGKDTLTQYFETEESARRIGEVALVDGRSPVFQSGLVYYNILLDENAACHIALGSSYVGAVDGGESLSEQEYEASGANVSKLHTDFMIGSDQMSIAGRTGSGTLITIMKDGRFAL